MSISRLKPSSFFSTTLPLYALHLSVWLLILLSFGCLGGAAVEEAAAPGQLNSIPPTLRVQHPSGQMVAAKDVAELQEFVPFDIVLPKNLPLGFQPRLISVQLPPDFVDEQVKERHVQVILYFRNKDGTAAFQLFEDLVAPDIDSPSIRSLHQDDIVVKVLPANEEHRLIAAVWEACDIGFFLTGGPSDQLTDANLMRIVEATLEACE